MTDQFSWGHIFSDFDSKQCTALTDEWTKLGECVSDENQHAFTVCVRLKRMVPVWLISLLHYYPLSSLPPSLLPSSPSLPPLCSNFFSQVITPLLIYFLSNLQTVWVTHRWRSCAVKLLTCNLLKVSPWAVFHSGKVALVIPTTWRFLTLLQTIGY